MIYLKLNGLLLLLLLLLGSLLLLLLLLLESLRKPITITLQTITITITFSLLLHLLLLLNQRNITQSDNKVIFKDFITSMVLHTTTDTLS